MKYIFFIIYILLTSQTYSFYINSKQDSAKTIKIDSISISGNEKTEDFIILRELDFKEGSKVSESQLDYNRERIYSLGIFNDVQLKVVNYPSFTLLKIYVEESWYIYPLPYLVVRENSLKKSTYGIGILYKNFRGRNETLWALITFGYDPAYAINYYNPNLITNKNYLLGFDIGFVNASNKSLAAENIYGGEFSYDYFYSTLKFGYRFNQFNTLTQNTYFEYVNLPNTLAGISASKKDKDRIFSLGFRYELDNRNLKQYSSDGTFVNIDYVHKGFGINNISYNILSLDVRKYNTIYKNLTAKWRGAFRSTFGGQIPFYALSILGDIEYLRGHRFNKREGHNYLITSFEVNYPIINEWKFSMNLPYLPKSLTSARIGLFANLFIDSGLTFNNGERITPDKLDTGWGAGLTLLILPYNAFRIEYAFNELYKGEILFETGFSF